MRAFGARGYVSTEQLTKTAAYLAKCRRETQREKIAALSNQDIVILMARVITTCAQRAPATVTRQDFQQGGVPDHRIDNNFDAAMRLARRQDPKIDSMRAAPCGA